MFSFSAGLVELRIKLYIQNIQSSMSTFKNLTFRKNNITDTDLFNKQVAYWEENIKLT